MPGLSVEKLQAELEARSLNLPIIVVTAYNDPETTWRKARKMEAVGFFDKPVDGTALLNAIDWAIQSNGVDGNRENVQSFDPDLVVVPLGLPLAFGEFDNVTATDEELAAMGLPPSRRFNFTTTYSFAAPTGRYETGLRQPRARVLDVPVPGV
jgi:hypothetical protein